MSMKHIKNLVFEGGGVRGIAYVGALEVLARHDMIHGISRVGGSAAGAITAALFALFRRDVAKIREIQKRTDFSSFADSPGLIVRPLLRLFRRFG